MARRARETSGTGIYHVMLRGINRQNIFEDEEDYRRFAELLFMMAFPTDDSGKPLPPRCFFYAYCLMTNHAHKGTVPLCSHYVKSEKSRFHFEFSFVYTIFAQLPIL